jgi:hypothetical protein
MVVVDVLQKPSADPHLRVFGLLIRGQLPEGPGVADAQSIVLALQLQPVAGMCNEAPTPVIPDQLHPDAVKPVIGLRADLAMFSGPLQFYARGPDAVAGTTTWSAEWSTTAGSPGIVEGWVTLQFPNSAHRGFCAFDLSGSMTATVSRRSVTADLPRTRIDTRDRLDGSVDNAGWALELLRADPLALSLVDLRIHLPSENDAAGWQAALEEIQEDAGRTAIGIRHAAGPPGLCYEPVEKALTRLADSVFGMASVSLTQVDVDLAASTQAFRDVTSGRELNKRLDRLLPGMIENHGSGYRAALGGVADGLPVSGSWISDPLQSLLDVLPAVDRACAQASPAG